MKPTPQTAAQKKIADAIDSKARAIADGCGYWNPKEIREKMILAIPSDGEVNDDEFANRYTDWRSEHPF
jgi:hypothetical protein